MRTSAIARHRRTILAAALASALAGLAAVQLTLGAAAPGATPALATAVGPIDPVAAALTFGVMTEGSATVVTNENDGTMAVGGDLTFGQYQVANNDAGGYTAAGDTRPTSLVVGGKVNFAGSVAGTRLQVLKNSYVKIGNLAGTFVRDRDNNNASVNTRVLPSNNYDATPRIELATQQPVASVGPASPINFASAFSTFRKNSSDLATCDNTVVLRDANGNTLPATLPANTNAYIRLTAGVTNVLNITGANLDNIANLTFANQPTAPTPLLVNVLTSGSGNAYSWKTPNFSGIAGPHSRYVLFNFPTATSLALTSNAATVDSTIYAPNAALTDNSATNTEGSIIVKSMDHRGGEVHYYPFATTLSCGGTVSASLSVTKSSTTTAITTVGQKVPYRYLVVNTGTAALTDVAVTDTQTAPSSNANLSAISCPSTSLAAGASTTCTATYTVTQADLDHGSLGDRAVAGAKASGTTVTSEASTLSIPAASLVAAISLVKSSTTTAITTVGQQVPYSFLVVNSGTLTLRDVAVTDQQTAPSANGDMGPISCPVTTLAPGESTTCSGTYTVTQADLDNGSVADTAMARGTQPSGATVQSTPAPLSIAAANLAAAVTLVKTSTTASVTTPGQAVRYRFVVVNSGAVTLSGVHVTDAQTAPSSNANLGAITCPVTTLAPGASTTCTATYAATQADLDHGSVADVATAHASPPGGAAAIASAPAPLTIPAADLVPSVSIVKSSSTTTINTVGQVVPLEYQVVNTGRLTLHDVVVTDVQVGGPTAPATRSRWLRARCRRVLAPTP